MFVMLRRQDGRLWMTFQVVLFQAGIGRNYMRLGNH
jgi:hypothetical protein